MKGAIFDMDGLLLDTERLYQESWVEMAKQFGQKPHPAFPSAVSGTNGEGMRQIIREYYPAVDAHAFQWIEKFLPRHHVGLYSIKEQITPDRPITLALPIAALFGGGR